MAEENQKITVRPSGPYLVRGAIPLVRKSQVMSEHGEPLDWKDEGVIDTGETYRLCRYYPQVPKNLHTRRTFHMRALRVLRQSANHGLENEKRQPGPRGFS